MDENRESEVFFIGKITASITHEIKNVFASIKELSGLMEDLVSISETETFPLKEKFQRLVPKIQDQVQRGNDIVKSFNTFAHLSDESVATIDLEYTVDHLISISKRFARQKNIELAISENENKLSVETNPLQLLMALFYTLELLIKNLKDSSKILISSEKISDVYKIYITGNGEIENKDIFIAELNSSERCESLLSMLQNIDGTIEFVDSENSFEFTLPKNINVETS